MNCTSCQHENPPGSRFCLECGAALGTLCAECGAELPPGAKFCNQCGTGVQGVKGLGGSGLEASRSSPTPNPVTHNPRSSTPRHLADKILQSKSTLEGERKQVTVMFADVKGSMELEEQMDPEQWAAIMQRFFLILSEGVQRFEGFVDKFTGDGIMALFGAPIAREDHAQRACWAALRLRDTVRDYADELRRTHGLSFSVRIGINSGEVVVGHIGDDLRMEYTAQGHTVGLAQRMEQLAEPGTTYLTEHTRRLVEGYFELRELGAFRVKGVSDPIEVFALEDAGELRTRLDLSRARGFSRFVGRQSEMEALQSALSNALEGNGQIVGVVGEAGVGKSRLCMELVGRCRGRAIPVWEAHCPAHGRALPMFPVLELTRRFFGIEDRDPPAEVRRKAAGTLALLDDDLTADLALVFDFLQVPDPERPLPPLSPEQRRRRLLAFLRRSLAARSEKQPAVLYLDDLHWIDDESDAFLAHLVEAVGTTRTLFLLNFRPEYQALWMNRADYRRIPVLPLGPEAIEEMLDALVGKHPSVEDLRTRIRDRANGNPFFTEELVRAFVESGALEGEPGAYRLVSEDVDVALPANVQSILSARIDRLDERDKRVLHAAAVIGREFDDAVLERVLGLSHDDLAASLEALRNAEFIYETALYPVAEYVFKHPLTQEVAYTSQLSEHRRQAHAAVGHAMIEVSADRLDERSALIAHHLEEGGEIEEAAGWHARAGRWSSLRDAAVSQHHWRRVRELLSAIDGPDILSLKAEACREILFTSWRAGTEESEWKAVYEEGVELARRADDKAALAMLLSGIAGMRGFRGEHRAQVELLEEALKLIEGAGNFVLEASLLQRIGWAWGLAGNNHRQLEWTERGLKFCEPSPEGAGRVGGFATFPWLHAQHGWALLYMGRFAEAAQGFERALALVGEDFTRAYASNGLFTMAWFRLDRAGMKRWGPLSEASSAFLPYAWASLAELLVEEGDWAGAIDASEKANAAFEELRPSGIMAFYLNMRAWWALAHAGGGNQDRARELVTQIRNAIAARPELGTSVPLVQSFTRTLLAVEGHKARAEILHYADQLSRGARGGFSIFEPFARQYRGELASLEGDEATRVGELKAAADLFRKWECDARADQIEQQLN